MDLIPIIDNKDYLIADKNLSIVQFSSNSQKYINCEQNIALGKDIRTILPEIIGLESICEEILLGQQESFVLESITRNQEANSDLYFDLYIKSIENYLVVLFEDVTQLTLLKQTSLQRLNEAEIALNKLQRFEYCTNKIIASMRDVLLITTPQGRIERINKSTSDLFGQKKSELINQSIDNLIQDQTFNHQQIYNYLLSSQQNISKIEVDFTTRHKKEIQIEFDCFIAPTEIKDFFNCVYIGRDITARKRAEAEIRNSLVREQELRQLKSGFISMASHEFRNPLSSILLCVQNLSGENNLNDSERDFYLQSIKDAALNMNSLLEDVLILSKAESGKQKLKFIQLNLEDFCHQIIQELESIYADKKVNLDYQVEISPVFLDNKTLRHILSNLLSNALKYSPPEETVELKLFSSQEPAEIIIEVCDRGIGIPQESQKHIFESFYRANNVENTVGTGLGLSIVKKSVELYQGSITIDSKVDQGTKILVKLPVKNK